VLYQHRSSQQKGHRKVAFIYPAQIFLSLIITASVACFEGNTTVVLALSRLASCKTSIVNVEALPFACEARGGLGQ
jgi:hypothetical protein